MAAILIYERQRMREIEAETANINLVRRGINTAHRRITGLATLGEGVVIGTKRTICTIVTTDFKPTVC